MEKERAQVKSALDGYDSMFGNSDGDLVDKDRRLLIAIAKLLLVMTESPPAGEVAEPTVSDMVEFDEGDKPSKQVS